MVKGPSTLTTDSLLSIKAPAKINWFLSVLRKRDDDYHDIETFMQCIELFDIIHLYNSDKIEIVSNLNIPVQDNLVFKAVSLLKRYTSDKKGVKIVLQKNIPVSAGLGGGSSDAAYTLLGVNKLWGLGLTEEELVKLGLKIGSDVPFFIGNTSAFVEGRGEKITTVPIDVEIILLIVKPHFTVSTKWAYSSFDKLRIGKLTKRTVDIKLFCKALNNKDFSSLKEILINDLEGVVIKRYPAVGEIKKRLLERGALISSMSGSGPTVFGVFESLEEAKNSSKSFKDCWTAVVRTMKNIDNQ
ncbi:MAG: 4-(cytidine 5'-diphospho)-2-C-methyl-D-erythritol kinase [Thermodesulfovibrionales bacterium]